jgi:hypothetical protein
MSSYRTSKGFYHFSQTKYIPNKSNGVLKDHKKDGFEITYFRPVAYGGWYFNHFATQCGRKFRPHLKRVAIP